MRAAVVVRLTRAIPASRIPANLLDSLPGHVFSLPRRIRDSLICSHSREHKEAACIHASGLLVLAGFPVVHPTGFSLASLPADVWALEAPEELPGYYAISARRDQ